MSKCGKCWMRYCSNACSLRHWQVHKPICKNLTSWLETHKSKGRKSKKYAALLHKHIKPGMGFCFLNEEQYAICLRTMKSTCLSMMYDIGPKGKAQRTAEPDATGAARACGSGGDPGETTARACGEPKHTAVEPDIAPVAVAPAVTVIPKDNVGTFAMSIPPRKKTLVPPNLVGFHNLNRDGIACNGDRCDSLLGTMIKNGFDKDEANRDNYAIRVSGQEDICIKDNIEVCDEQAKLATMAPDWKPTGMTLAHSHVNQILKNINHGAPSNNHQVTPPVDVGFLRAGRSESRITERIRQSFFKKEARRKHLFTYCQAASASSAAPTTLGPVATPIPLRRLFFCSPVDLGAAGCASKFVYDVVWLMYNADLPRLRRHCSPVE